MQSAARLKKLSINVAGWQDYDQGEYNIDDSLALPVILHNVPTLSDFRLRVLPNDKRDLTGPEIAYEGSLLSALIKAISLLYRNTETLEFKMNPGYPTCTVDILSYLSGLKTLRKLRWWNPRESYEFSKKPMMEMRTLEYLDTNSPDLLSSLRAPNILSLNFSWEYHGAAKNLGHDHVRKLQITYTNVGHSMVELSGDSFMSLEDLTLTFAAFANERRAGVVVYRDLKLTSFQILSSITIISYGFTSYGTMLCFSLLDQPEECPALHEITFGYSPPDWDALFLMLEKRNFMLDASVSKIHTITLPFIPNEIRAPLAALLGGRYAERPSNEDLVMGGAQELIFDENVPGCVTCLLSMKAGCQEEVLIVGKDDVPPGYDQIDAMSIRFNWQADPGHEDAATVEWIKQRRSLHRNFLQSLEIWGKRYQRFVRCMRGGNEMEMTEYGVRLIPYSELREVFVSP